MTEDTEHGERSTGSDPVRAARAEVGQAGVERPDPSTAGERPGDRIGRYKLLQCIGEGGFGTVYMAEQKEPVRRRVALKIIKLGMDTRQVIARFEAERQALALMDHPNIARVLDAGATETGRPFFVMELVKGVPITAFCDDAHLTTRGRLELFTKVCRAVQHAHQKGIIHRDLKPSNVLVTLHDGEPVPKVIDFGIAKATNQELTQKTLFTEFRQFIGTPEYMSPEQAEISGLDVDTRSDIYSLGVLLYELLTGTPPVDRRRLQSAAFEEIRRIIREEEAPRPSTRLTTLGDSITSVARARGAEPASLVRSLRGDLDWIVLKALEKDRTRRYETVNDLAADIERHVRDEPVLASPPSRVYRLRKFLRRNRGSVAATAAVGALLVLGIVGTTSGYLQASRALRVSQEQRRLALESEERALAEARKQQELALFFHGVLFSTSPLRGEHGTDQATVTDLLETAALRLAEGALSDQPGSRGILHSALGDAFRDRESWRDAAAQYESAVAAFGDDGEHAVSRSTAARRLAWLARELDESTLGIRVDTEAMQASAIAGLERQLAGSEPREEAIVELFRWCQDLFRARRIAEAERLVDRVRELVLVLDPEVLPFVEYARAGILDAGGRRGEADAIYSRIAEPMRRALPQLHRLGGGTPMDEQEESFGATALGFSTDRSLAAIGWKREELVEAGRALFERDPRSVMQALSQAGLAWRLISEGRDDEALETMRAVVETARSLKENPAAVGLVLGQFGSMLAATGRGDEGLAAMQEGKALLATSPGNEYGHTLVVLGILLHTMGRCDEALEHLQEAEPLLAKQGTSDYYMCLGALAVEHGERALALLDGDPAAAGVEASRFLAGCETALGWDDLGFGYVAFVSTLVADFEAILATWEGVDPGARDRTDVVAVQSRAKEWIPRFLETAARPDALPRWIHMSIWGVLAQAPVEEPALARALELAAASLERTGLEGRPSAWYDHGEYLTVLAQATFGAGDRDAARAYQRAAVQLARSEEDRASRAARLADYEASATDR